MGSLKNQGNRVFGMSSNVIMTMDDNDMGEMYIYDKDRGYILNGMTASDLVDYFAYKNDMNRSNEIMDILLNMTINKGTH